MTCWDVDPVLRDLAEETREGDDKAPPCSRLPWGIGSLAEEAGSVKTPGDMEINQQSSL